MNINLEKLLYNRKRSDRKVCESERLSSTALVEAHSTRHARKTRELLKKALDSDLSEIRTKAVFSFNSQIFWRGRSGSTSGLGSYKPPRALQESECSSNCSISSGDSGTGRELSIGDLKRMI